MPVESNHITSGAWLYNFFVVHYAFSFDSVVNRNMLSLSVIQYLYWTIFIKILRWVSQEVPEDSSNSQTLFKKYSFSYSTVEIRSFIDKIFNFAGRGTAESSIVSSIVLFSSDSNRVIIVISIMITSNRASLKYNPNVATPDYLFIIAEESEH